MKIIVFSDSHRNVRPMVAAAAAERPDVIIHLGDLEGDAAELSRHFPGVPMYSVPGNCDYLPIGPKRLLICLEGKSIFAAHGHAYGVKGSPAAIVAAAHAVRADAVLFGHTHSPYCAESFGMLVANPGSIGMGGRTYGILTISGGEMDWELKRAEL